MGFFRFMGRFYRDAWTFAVPLTCVILAAVVSVLTGHVEAAWFVGNIGVVLVVFGNIIYIVAFDPLGRRRHLSKRERAKRFFTFSRRDD